MRVASSVCLALLLFASGSALAADGAALYAKNCASCHGADGKADGAAAKAMNVPPVAGKSMSPDALVKYVQENAKHKAVAGKLSAEELAAIAGALPGS